MTISPDLTAQILRYHHAERWPVGTIASQLSVHRETVMRVLTQAGVVPIVQAPRPSGLTAYLPFIEQTLRQFPNLSASRLYAMVVERGYGGRPDHFRHVIARHRPSPPAQAYLRLCIFRFIVTAHSGIVTSDSGDRDRGINHRLRHRDRRFR